MAPPKPATAAPKDQARERIDRTTPETWLAGIRRLVERQDRREARTELLAFRMEYPDRPIPDDLRPLLE